MIHPPLDLDTLNEYLERARMRREPILWLEGGQIVCMTEAAAQPRLFARGVAGQQTFLHLRAVAQTRANLLALLVAVYPDRIETWTFAEGDAVLGPSLTAHRYPR